MNTSLIYDLASIKNFFELSFSLIYFHVEVNDVKLDIISNYCAILIDFHENLILVFRFILIF